jgi:hypothetical protein
VTEINLEKLAEEEGLKVVAEEEGQKGVAKEDLMGVAKSNADKILIV